MRAVRAVTTYKGRDQEIFFVRIGGAGGLRTVELAKTLKIKVLVPKAGGVLVRLGCGNLEASETAPLLSLLAEVPLRQRKRLHCICKKITKTIGGDVEGTFKSLLTLGSKVKLVIKYPFQNSSLDEEELKILLRLLKKGI